MISKTIDGTSLNRAIVEFKRVYGRPVNAAVLADLFEQAKANEAPSSPHDRNVRQALDAMAVALQVYNEAAVEQGQPSLELEDLIPRVVERTATAITDGTADGGTGLIDPAVVALRAALGEAIVGQRDLCSHVLVAMITGGHILLEGPPGTAKTLAAKTVGDAVDGKVGRINFTPDLVPTDITGGKVFDETLGDYRFVPGPLFANVVIADEINRTMPKVQAAFLEGMNDGEVTVDGKTHQLPRPSTIIATMNPLEQDGTFPLPEAQKDRFMMNVLVDHPSAEEQVEIAKKDLQRSLDCPPRDPVVTQEQLTTARERVRHVGVPEELLRYAVDLVRADPLNEAAATAGTRAVTSLVHAAQAHAYLEGRMVISEADIQAMLGSILRHRVSLDYDRALAHGRTVEDFIQTVLDTVQIPSRSDS